MASAQAMSFPYSARDAALIANRLHYLNLQDAVAAVPLRLTSSSSQPSQMSQLDKEVGRRPKTFIALCSILSTWKRVRGCQFFANIHWCLGPVFRL